ncbi:ArsR family transcriptional regulator [Arthrobacter sp. SDTb3-6]|uniref:ArsR family transcriptional regulator n=1 Tax=Arthrobacter sp. SDTb3-6 TaxID=2713571 RepID=UPI00159D969F|nr:ArsR family transcriptional regulator [Arthrobacter sp. SDTb3-6]
MSRILCTAISSRLLHLLSAGGPRDVPGICEAMHLKPGRVRHHLKALGRGGFVNIDSSSPHGYPSRRYAADAYQVDKGLSRLLAEFGADGD